MHTHTCPHSGVSIHVNGDWSGEASVHTASAGAIIPVWSLLRGHVNHGRATRGELSALDWAHAVAWAVYSYMSDKTVAAVESVALP